MGTIYLKDGRTLNLTMEQSIDLAKLFFFIPDFKTITVNGETFAMRDIDTEMYRKMQLPQQTGMELGVETVDNRPNKTNQ